MKFQISNLKFQIFLMVIFLILTSHFLLLTSAFAEGWKGVDESVIEKYAKEHGREAITPIINTDQGDLLLFVFLIAGTVGGFVAGYYWRTLITQRAETKEQKKEK